MRLVTFRSQASSRLGALDGEDVIDLASGDPTLPTSMVELIATWDLDRTAAAAARGDRIPVSDVALAPPVIPRKNVIAVGRNYRDHAQEFSDSGFDASTQQTIPDHPMIFTKPPSSIIGHGEAIVLANDPTGTTDYEGEMAVVIGKPAKNVEREKALDHVFGWTVCNDVTARDLQKRHIQWFVGKSPDTFCPLGPCITTRDELPDIRSSWMRTFVNGEKRQQAPISALIFDVESLIVTLSEVMTLHPGDVIATGTGVGVGIGFDPPVYLKHGDVVEISIDGIGTLSNPVE